MTRGLTRARAHDGERGAALILAIGLMMAVGAISAGLLAFISTSVGARPQLDKVRNRQYAADAAIELAIANVRTLAAPAETSCASSPGLIAQNLGPFTLNGVSIHVTCQDALDYVLGAGVILLQRNVIFTVCEAPAAPCTAANAIIRAQVNYESIPASPLLITRTYIQSWSVVQ